MIPAYVPLSRDSSTLFPLIEKAQKNAETLENKIAQCQAIGDTVTVRHLREQLLQYYDTIKTLCQEQAANDVDHFHQILRDFTCWMRTFGEFDTEKEFMQEQEQNAKDYN